MRAALEARVHDTFWLLGRQWQLGEFRGTDGGSPVVARFRAESASFSRCRPGPPGSASAPYDPSVAPLESLVESERVHEGPEGGIRLAAEAGLHFLRLLVHEHVAPATRAGYVAEWRLEPPSEDAEAALDEATRRYWKTMANRVPDGARLYPALQEARTPASGGPPGLPGAPEIRDAAEAGRVGRAADAWLAWYEALFREPEASAWIAERMEYAFAVAARTSAGEVVLGAREYHGDRLDWPAFAVETDASLGADAAPRPIDIGALPSPAGFRGMPAARWWEMEDAQVDLGSLEAEPEDLLRLLLVEFSALYANDWFLLPVELQVGTLCRPVSLVVVDSFGQRTLVRPYTQVDPQGSGWRMFHVAPDVFVLPPTVASRLQGAPVEEVLLLRDEMANLAWAVERVVESRAGRPLRRAEAYQAERERSRRASTGTAERGALDYHVTAEVPPPYWIPLVPEKIDARSIRLRRGRTMGPDGTPGPGPQGRILQPRSPLWLYEEEVPRSGTSLTRAFRLARWSDGSTHLWVGRRKQPGRGEGASGLRFDVVAVAGA